jgi:hypothetical protein
MSGDDASLDTEDTKTARRRVGNHKYYMNTVKPRNELKKQETEKQKKSQKARRTAKVVKKASPPVFEEGRLAPFVNELLKTKSKKMFCNFAKWEKLLEKNISVYCKCTFPSSRSLTGPQIAGDEIVKEREYIIACKKDRLYEVKKSGIKDANFGLFALRPFKTGEVMGVYFGKIVKDVSKKKNTVNDKSKKKDRMENEVILTCYAMECEKMGITVDCLGGVDSKHPTYFGLQFANDPILSENNDRARGEDRAHNFFVDENLIARACLDIKTGQELFLYYKYEDERECKCIGCKARERDYGE